MAVLGELQLRSRKEGRKRQGRTVTHTSLHMKLGILSSNVRGANDNNKGKVIKFLTRS